MKASHQGYPWKDIKWHQLYVFVRYENFPFLTLTPIIIEVLCSQHSCEHLHILYYNYCYYYPCYYYHCYYNYYYYYHSCLTFFLNYYCLSLFPIPISYPYSPYLLALLRRFLFLSLGTFLLPGKHSSYWHFIRFKAMYENINLFFVLYD